VSFIEHPIEWDDAKVSRLWNYYSRRPPYSDNYFSKLFGEQILKRSGLPLAEPIEVLDFGCGPGHLWEHMMRLGARWSYTGLDFSPDSVASVLHKAHGHPQFKDVQQVTCLPAKLPDDHFDAALLVEVVEHLEDEHLDGTLDEVARVLKRGGLVVITTPNEEDLAKATRFCPECGAIYHEWQHVRSWSVRSLATRLQQHRLTLRFARTLDFRAKTALGQFLWMVWRVLKKNPTPPHMLAVFQKA
jgi:SAM-dependent methyltransferase